MTESSLPRRLRAVLRTALLWSATWFVSVLVIFTALKLVGFFSASAHWADGLFVALRAAIVGFVAGGAFAGFISWVYRGRRLAEMNPIRFGIAGGLATAIFVPTFLQLMNIISGDGMVAMNLVLDDGLWTGVLGGLIAGISLKIAQRSRVTMNAAADRPIDLLDSADRSPPATELKQRASAAERD